MKRNAVYAGSFDPPTSGHLDVIRRVQPLFDRLHLVVAVNGAKHSLFSAEERVELLRESVAEVLPRGSFEVPAPHGLIVDFCRDRGIHCLIRGLRAVSDFEKEFQMAAMNRRLDSSIETLHVMTDESFFFVSSSLVKELAHHRAPLKGLVPRPVLKALRAKGLLPKRRST